MNQIFAPAKLTLGFRVVGQRSDGYHLIDSEMTMVSFGDSIEVLDLFPRHDGRTSKFEVVDPLGLSRFGISFAAVPTGSDNLLDRVAALFDVGIYARLQKRIPVGGGLGGGSADAGALTRYLISTFHESSNLDRTNLIFELSKLGADIPVCFLARRAHVSGIGEIVEPLEGPQQGEDRHLREVTLFLAPISISTPAVFRAFDEAKKIDIVTGHFANHLEGPALAVSPALRSFRESIEKRFSVAPSLAGSGSTYFTVGHVIDQMVRDEREFISVDFGDEDEFRIVTFPDVNDRSIIYLACECREVQLGVGAR